MGDFAKLIKEKRRQHENALARHAIKGTNPKFRMKLRVRFASRLASDQTIVRFSFLGRRVAIKSRRKGEVLSSAEWILFTAGRFRTIEAAAEYGVALQSALSVIAVTKGNVSIATGC
jgi:hypothetical protein